MRFLLPLLIVSLHPLPPVPLDADTHHVQGIEVHGNDLWLSSVDIKTKHGYLYLFERQTGKLSRTVEVQQGERYHPGGISRDGDSLWVPVAEYRRNSSATIQKRNAKTLALEFEFPADDHIGAVAVTPGGLIGANWNTEQFSIWDKSGKLQRKAPNPTGVAIQDMKFVDGKLIAGGLLKDGSGMIVWLKWPELTELQRLPVGKTDRGIALTHEGLAIEGDRLYLLPEDQPSRLFPFVLD